MGLVSKLRAKVEPCALGCKASPPDDRDHMYDPRVGIQTPARVGSPKYFATKQLYQGRAPSCAEFAVAHALMIEEARLPKPARNSIPSTSWLYWWACEMDGGVKKPLEGTYLRYALHSLHKYGCPSNIYRKYKDTYKSLSKKPTDQQMFWAGGRMGIGYEWINQGSLLNGIRSALSEGHPVVFGTQATQAMMDYKEGQVLYCPAWEDLWLGGHALCLVDFVDDRFLVQNSWRGREFMWMHEDYIDWHQSFDFAILKVER